MSIFYYFLLLPLYTLRSSQYYTMILQRIRIICGCCSFLLIIGADYIHMACPHNIAFLLITLPFEDEFFPSQSADSDHSSSFTNYKHQVHRPVLFCGWSMTACSRYTVSRILVLCDQYRCKIRPRVYIIQYCRLNQQQSSLAHSSLLKRGLNKKLKPAIAHCSYFRISKKKFQY